MDSERPSKMARVEPEDPQTPSGGHLHKDGSHHDEVDTVSTSATKSKKSWADLADEEDAERGAQAVRIVKVANDMAVVQRFLSTGADIAEAYSPPRLTSEAKEFNLRCGFSFEITVPDADGTIWDFSKRSCRTKAWKRLKEQRTYMLVGSPPGTAGRSFKTSMPEPQRARGNSKRPRRGH